MKAKAFELRARGTFIAILAVELAPENDAQSYLISGCGYALSARNIIMTRLDGTNRSNCDPYAWGDRTYSTAHAHIISQWETLRDGDVIDVEFILGETKTAKVSMRNQ